MKRALITGINGMDGSHLADLLLSMDYTVFGMERRSSTKNRKNTGHLEDKITFLTGDLTDQHSLVRVIKESNPHEIYNLASQSFVGESWNTPEQTSDVTGLGVLRMLEAIREVDKNIRFYQASSSEMFGKMLQNPANENTPFYPRSPYGVAKLYGHWITKNYRESYKMFACSGILFNHESERRGMEFVTRKICDGVARIVKGLDTHISLGNLDSKRDWGYAPDYVRAMWMMLQFIEPNDFVVATGKTHSIRDFLDIAFDYAGTTNWKPYVKIDSRFYRPAEVDVLRGDYTKIKQYLDWEPKVEFEELVNKMMEEEFKRYEL